MAASLTQSTNKPAASGKHDDSQLHNTLAKTQECWQYHSDLWLLVVMRNVLVLTASFYHSEVQIWVLWAPSWKTDVNQAKLTNLIYKFPYLTNDFAVDFVYSALTIHISVLALITLLCKLYFKYI